MDVRTSSMVVLLFTVVERNGRFFRGGVVPVTKYIRIGIGDKNDNPPYFGQALYEAEVNEDEDVQHTVITVTAKDKDEYNLNENHTTVLIKVKDVNDNAPIFDRPTYEAQITEENDRNLPQKILQVTATDGDKDRESLIVYFLTGQGVDEDLGNSKFAINTTTGEIYVLKPLDRDLPHGRSQWRFTVFAEDEGGNGLVGFADVLVNLKDVNDNAPFFPSAIYTGNVTENGTAGMTVMTMTATDYDDPNEGNNARLTYSIEQNQVNENGELIFTIDEETGVISTAVCCLDRETNPEYTIKVVAVDGGGLKGESCCHVLNLPLDYEDLQQRFGFNITIQVSDNGGESTDPYHADYAKVKVRVKDINDNKPEFERPNIEVSVPENSTVGSSLATFKATDADQGGKSRVSYMIDRSSDKKRQFKINPNGVVEIQRTLDREDIPRHQVKILAIDDGVPSRTATATLTVVVSDINDNPPRFQYDYRPVIPEHTPPQKVQEILATDDDDRSKNNGPPFTFRMDPNAPELIQQFFRVEHDPTGANGDGMAVVRSRETFDRETQKEYLVPILIKDNGNPSLTGTSTLTVIIGDINDNRMHPGSKSIFVYNFKGESPPTKIGRIHVEDLDDWDLPDKTFFWENNNAHPNFDMDGITDEDFIRVWDWKKQRQVKSKYEIFRDLIAELIKTKPYNVDIFSVILKQSRPPITDIRFSAHGSPYYKASLLNGVVAVNRREIENKVGINITMVGIDECLLENHNCEGSCTNVLMIDRNPVMVNANRTSFVGVNTWVKAKCTCGARDFSEIESCRKRPPPCYNNGRCVDTYTGISCRCPSGFHGPQCQQTTRHFNGKGWAWFPPLQQCEESHLSLEFMTDRATGLLLYNGPISRPDPGELVIQDFISLELNGGRPRLLLDFGSGTAELLVQVEEALNDENWHRLDVFWDRQSVRLMVDNCLSARTHEGNQTIDRSRCENSTQVPEFNEFLNVNTPLQLGGTHVGGKDLGAYAWQYRHTTEGFQGCIKNVIHNSEMYDLGSPGSSYNSVAGCPPAESSCSEAALLHQSCGHGHCLGTYKGAECVCDPGWHGPNCDRETQSKMFQQSSYIKYALPFDPHPYKTDIQLQFRTRQKHGELFRITSKHGREYCILEIRDKKLRFRFNLDRSRTSDERELWLPWVWVNDGQWHTVRALRHGASASLALDGGSGRRYNELVDWHSPHQHMWVEKQNVIAGGDVQYVGPGVTVVDNDYQEGCMNDIRLDQHYLPMESGSEYAAVVEWRNLIDGCPSNNPCHGISCPRPFVCVDLWMLHECKCSPGFAITENGKNCTDADECLSEPCLNGGTCMNRPHGEGFYCLCPDGFGGDLCGALRQEKIMRLSMAALAAILVCLLNILILVLVIVAYTRSRRSDQKFGHGGVDDDVRENIISYEDEGGGEDDMNAYDITPLRIPVDASGTPLGAKPGPDKAPPLLKEVRLREHNTLWPFCVDTHVTPPFRKEGTGKIYDRHGKRINVFPDVPAMLECLTSQRYLLGLASR
ncbi:Gb2-cadherin, putative [Ixodes scapularis]|uniref:Gb2-cadherin, putative n=2 Tax=Ixodes scapularis TaxID=6945 RepID=B7QEF7_IXOSC|nr:Gb2-cadherin, putative [Ixodes scapularis]|eukprot:XP_002413931.1 Gb2-cadherin, putative [Ixodes scapularis]